MASCIGALTFTYLHVNSFSKLKMDTIENQSLNSSTNYSIQKNIKQYDMDCQNLYNNLRYNEERSLQLKKQWEIECMEDIQQLENSIQIYAEYINIISLNTYSMEVLKLSSINELPEFKSFSSMYHYQWEEAFHCLVNPMKTSKERNNIESIFNEFFTVTPMNQDTFSSNDYINYLSKLYHKMFNIIVS